MSPIVFDETASGPIYATVAQLRAEPEVPDSAPPSDADLIARIIQAEDKIDEWLGPWTVHEDTGRKIATSDVLDWQFAKLTRATVRLAVALYVNPRVLQAREWGSIKGPQFEKSQPIGSAASPGARLPDVVAALNASGLRIMSGRAGA